MAQVGWGHALAAGVGGYLKGQQLVSDRDEKEAEKKQREEDRAWQAAQRERTKKQQGVEDTLQTNLQDAARPVVVAAGAGGMIRPDTMDNRDVGLPENAALPNGGLLPGGFRVADQQFTDRSQADAAAAKANAPEAVNGRVVAAYRGAGQVDKAMQIESNTRTAEVQKMQLADAKWRKDLGTAMGGGHQGLASLATNSEGGPMAGLTVQAVAGPDGRITYGAVGPDGAVKPIPGLPTFSNDQNGITQAAFMLDKTITPEARMAHMTAEEARAQKKSDGDRDYKLKEREVDSKIELRGAQAENMALRASIAAAKVGGGGGAGKQEGAEPFDPLKDFDPKQARKGAMDQAIDEAKNSGKTATAAEIAKRAQDIYSQLRSAAASENTNMHVQSTVSGAFRKAGKDAGAYAETYEQARQVATPQQLAAWGFNPPGSSGGAKPAKPSAGGGQPMALQAPPAAPASAAPSDPAGARVDQARAQFAALRARPAPGMAAGRQAIDAYAAEVQAARQAVAEAEAEYQRVTPNAGAAFRTPSM